jgi:peptidyl-prolyl cis-trans isomerase D
MLRILREHASSWMLKLILVLVALSFVLFFGGYSLMRDKTETYVAKVNDTTIEGKEYATVYQKTIQQYRDALGATFSEKMVEELRLKDRILDNLINQVLVQQEGRRLGLDVSDQELRTAIESVPSFQADGQFDPRRYEWYLRENRLSADEFERIQKENLLVSKVVNLIRLNSGKISEGEVLETYLFENERVNLNFLKIPPDAFKGQVQANDVELKDFYQKHQEEFRIPASVQIQYLVFRPSDFEGKAQISADDIKGYYDRQKERFKTPQQARVREILVKAGPEDPADKVEEKRKKAEEILEKAKKSKDFGSAARQYSESETASKGGDLGWVQKGKLEEAADQVVFSLKKGEVSGVVRRPAGFSIFKVDDITEEKTRSLEEAKDQIVQLLKREKGRAEASRKADDAFYSLFRNRDLESYAREKGVPIKTTGFFKEGDEIPEIGRNPSFSSSAFSLKVGEITPVVSIPPNFYVMKLLEKKESRIPPLEEIKDEVERRLVGVKAEEKARQAAEELLDQVRKGKSLQDIAREKNLKVDETGFFTRAGGVVPKIGPASEFSETLASLTEKHPVPKEVIRTKEGFFVVKLLAAEPADQSKFPSVKANLEKRLLYQNQEEYFQNWLSGLKSKAKIVINKEVL